MDDAHSWAVDGTRQRKWHNDGETYACTWQAGDVIGLACDLDAMRMHVSVNGSFAAPNGVVFELAPDAVRDGLFAAFSGHTGKVRYNFGEVPFQYAPPSADYQAFASFAVSNSACSASAGSFRSTKAYKVSKADTRCFLSERRRWRSEDV